MEREICSCCLKPKYIVNRKYRQCESCNHLRLHGETKEETLQKQSIRYQTRYLEKQKGKSKIVNNTYKIGTTKKERGIKEKLSDIKKSIEMDAIQEGNYYCWGCGVSKLGLDKSHILSVKQRKDLELEKENINLLCRDCHMDWESNDIERMLKLDCFVKDFEYIQLKDKARFNQILTKIIELVERITKFQTLFFEETIKEKAFYIIKTYDYCEL